ncbi:MAG: glycosyltransferase [Nanoarchaeota archaeon]
MKILHVAPPFLPVDDTAGYGGIERVIISLAAKQDTHTVHLAAPVGSRLKNSIIHTTVTPPGFFQTKERMDYLALRHASAVLDIAHMLRPDVVHLHDDYLLPFAHHLRAPSVLTLHSPREDFFGRLEPAEQSGCHIVAISKRQQQIYEDAGFWVDEVIYHGVDTDHFVPSPDAPEHYLLSLGAIRPEKGQDIAIEIRAELEKSKVHLDLIIAGNIADQTYFDTAISPHINVDISSHTDKMAAYREHRGITPRVFYAGEVNDTQKIPLFQHAQAFLMPVRWEEPYGLVVAEAMSCGTPVLASALGSLPEIVSAESGRIVFLKSWTDGLLETLALPREGVRRYAETHMSTTRMAAEYEAAYRLVARK